MNLFEILNSGITFALLFAIAVSVWILIMKIDGRNKREKRRRKK